MKTGTKMSNAIERIKGYCCKVTREQWKELVKVADEVGCPVGPGSRCGIVRGRIMCAKVFCNDVNNHIILYNNDNIPNCINYSDFLAKLRGDEECTPKAGEMVEVGRGYVREYIAKRNGKHFCWSADGSGVSLWDSVRPLRPTITRAEAEEKLNARIID